MSEVLYDQYGNALFTNNNPGAVTVQGGHTAASQAPIAVTQAPKGPYQTLKTFTGTMNTSTTSTTVQSLYTVTPGKTFYVTDIIVCNNAGYPAQVSLNASTTPDASPIIIGHSLNTSPFDATNIGTEPRVAGGTPLTFQSLATSTATVLTYFIAGYEQ